MSAIYIRIYNAFSIYVKYASETNLEAWMDSLENTGLAEYSMKIKRP